MKGTPEITSSHQGKNLLDQITPHKVALVALIQQYCESEAGITQNKVSVNMNFLFTFMFPSPEREREFLYALLQLIQEADMDLPSLCDRLQATASDGLYKSFINKLEEIDENLDSLVSTFLNLNNLFTMQPNVITKTSVIGLFLRRLILAFDKLNFELVIRLYQLFRGYYKPLRVKEEKSKKVGVVAEEESGMDEPMTLQDLMGDEKTTTEQTLGSSSTDKAGAAMVGIHSKRQAEYFIAQQAQLLHHNESEALPPKQLQQKIMDLLRNDHNLAEAHFLSYLNSLRIREYVGALESLHHYFDRHCLQSDMLMASPSKSHKEEEIAGKGLRYAALNIASLHYRFGHRSEALAAVREAIRMAQETNDTVCLQHALGWLHRLGEQGSVTTAHLMERLCNKAIELNLPYLASLGVQSFAKHNAVATSKPSSVLEFISKSDVQNCKHSLLDLMSISFAQKAALWSFYGNKEMSNLSSQCMLNLNTAESGIYHNGESGCLSMCNLARLLADQGEFNMAVAVLGNCKQLFPTPSQHAHLWQVCEQQLTFDMAVHLRNNDAAARSVSSISALNEAEAHYRNAVLLKERGEFGKAHDAVEKLLKKVNEDKSGTFTAALSVRLLILLGDIQCCTGNPSRAGQPFLEALTLCKPHHLYYLTTITKLHLAHVQFQLGMPTHALDILQEAMIPVLSNGSLYDQGRLLTLYAKCTVAAAAKEPEQTKRQARLSAITLLKEAQELFQQVEAHLRVKDNLYLQACIYNALGYVEERNNCSFKFRQLDQLMPTQSRADVAAL